MKNAHKTVVAGAFAFFAASSAHATVTCSAQGLDALKQAILSQNKIADVPVAPTFVYNGLTGAQIASQAANHAGEAQYVQALANRLSEAVKAFIESDGDETAAATKLFGASNRRQTVEIIKRADENSAASANAKCGAGSCLDVALDVTTVHMIPGRTAQAVMDSMSARKLSSMKPAVVPFCETGSGCLSKDQLVMGNSKVRQENPAAPMRVGVEYTAREKATSPIGTVDNTSIYKITPLEICGQPAFLMTGISTRDANSFTTASSDSLVVEAGSRVLSITVAQGIAPKGSSVPGIFLNGLFGGLARKTLFTGYNESSKRLGTDETIDNNGFIR